MPSGETGSTPAASPETDRDLTSREESAEPIFEAKVLLPGNGAPSSQPPEETQPPRASGQSSEAGASDDHANAEGEMPAKANALTASENSSINRSPSVVVPESTRPQGHMAVYEVLPPDPQRLVEVGGAVAANVLGTWAIIGSWLTPWSMVHGVLGLFFGIWGLRSIRRRLAIVGICLSILGILFCSGQGIRDVVRFWTPSADEFELPQ